MFDNQRDVLPVIENSPIAGGAGYDGPTRSDADVVVTTRSGFEDHANDAGTVVWIPGNTSIELQNTVTVRATIASDRSSVSADAPGSGSPGALLYTNEHGSSSAAWDGGAGRGLLQFRGSGRLTGVRYRGPYHDHYDDERYPGYIPLDSGNASERSRKRAARSARGINIHSSSVEIDNCEIYGWPNQAINMGARNSAAYSPDIHHIYGHNCMMVGAGYVVDVIRGMPHIHDSYFDAARHAIDGFGYGDSGYLLERCVFGPSTYSHAVDMHCLSENGYSSDTNPNSSTFRERAGGTMIVRNNVFLYTEDIRGRNQECVVLRGVPEDQMLVEGNYFMHPSPPARNPGNSSPGNTWRQVNVTSSSWQSSTDSNGYTPNFIRRNNTFGIESVILPDGIEGGAEPPEPDKPRLNTRQTNREGKAQACRGLLRGLEADD